MARKVKPAFTDEMRKTVSTPVRGNVREALPERKMVRSKARKGEVRKALGRR